MVCQLYRIIRNCDLARAHFGPHIDCSFYGGFFSTAWFVYRHTTGPWNLTLSVSSMSMSCCTVLSFDGEIFRFFYSLEQQSRIYISVDVAEWTSLRTNPLLLLSTSPVIAYYSNTILDGGYSHLIGNVARSERGAGTALHFFLGASTRQPATFKFDSHFETAVLYFVA